MQFTFPRDRVLFVLALVGLLSCSPAEGQEIEVDAQGRAEEEILNGSSNNEADGERVDRYLEEIEALQRSPLDLRRASVESLALLPGFDTRGAATLVDLIQANPTWSLVELAAAAGLTEDQLMSLRTYTRYRHPGNRPRDDRDDEFTLNARLRVGSDLRRRRGYTDSIMRIVPRLDAPGVDSVGLDTVRVGTPYLGGQPALRLQVNAAWNRFAFGFSFRKDAGETFLADDTLEYEYRDLEYVDTRTPPRRVERRLAAHAAWYCTADLNALKLYAGNYSVATGEGLLLGGTSGGFAPRTTEPSRQGKRLVRHSGGTNGGSFTGLALEVPTGRFGPAGLGGTAFWSRRRFDASVRAAADGSDTTTQVVSLRDDGYQRTRTELRSSHELTENLAGMHFECRTSTHRVGLTGYVAAVDPESGEVVDRYGGASADWYIREGETSTFGEVAMDLDGSRAGHAGITTSYQGIDMLLGVRSVGKTMVAPHGDGPSLGRTTIGMRLASRLTPTLRCTASVEARRQNGATTTVPMPTWRTLARIEGAFRPIPTARIGLRVESTNDGDERLVGGIDGMGRKRMVERRCWSLRLDGEITAANGTIALRGRFDRRLSDPGGGLPWQSGLATTIDLRWEPIPTLTLRIRRTLFDGDGSDATIYLFEPDIGGTGNVAALGGHGSRLHIGGVWRPSELISISARYRALSYTDREVIAAGGYQELRGRTDDNIALELDLRF